MDLELDLGGGTDSSSEEEEEKEEGAENGGGGGGEGGGEAEAEEAAAGADGGEGADADTLSPGRRASVKDRKHHHGLSPSDADEMIRIIRDFIFSRWFSAYQVC